MLGTKTTAEHVGDMLLKDGIINEKQYLDAVELSGAMNMGISKVLVSLGYTSDSNIIARLAAEIGTGFIDFSLTEASPAAISAVSEDVVKRHHIVPVDLDEGVLTIAIPTPDNLIALDDVKIATGLSVKYVIAKESDLKSAIAKYYMEDTMVEDMMNRVGSSEMDMLQENYELKHDEEAPVIKLVNMILIESVRTRTSDIHLDPAEGELKVRMRIDGVLHESMRIPKKLQGAVISRLKLMSDIDIAERRIPQDGRFGATIDGQEIDFRVASLPAIHGEKIVMRLLKKSSIMLTLDDLGFLPRTLERFRRSFVKPYGAILVTGPTGSGKTTTLYATLNELNQISRNIISVEDPVEYRLKGINQVQVNVKAGMTFSAALRSILRNDPDIVMIGEMRDRETALIGIEAALTGHLVLSTLHTRSSAGALTRLTEMDIEPFLSSSAVDCVIAQRLARKLCSKCKEEYSEDVSVLEDIEFPLYENEESVKLYRKIGCRVCNNTGYSGRIGVYEVLIVTEAIEHLIVERATEDLIMSTAVQEGLYSMRQDGFEKVRRGVTSIEEVFRVTV